MQVDPLAYQRVRRAYELGRARTSFVRASVVVAPITLLASLFGGHLGLAWLPVTLATWLVVHWRGGPLLRGAYVGLAGGLVTLALPMTLLRPCCSPEAMATDMECCTQPSACITVGGLLGIVLAAFVPNTTARWRTAVGVAMGVASVAILRCSTLFAAEAVGLVGGLLGAILVATIGRDILTRRA